jgi:hypothetical protein
VTSRPANSEVYIIGLGFRGLAPALEAHLLASVEKFDFGRTLLPLGAPETEDMVSSLLAAARQIHMRQQIDFVTEAVALYEAYRGRMRSLRQALQPFSPSGPGRVAPPEPCGASPASARSPTTNGNKKSGRRHPPSGKDLEGEAGKDAAL